MKITNAVASAPAAIALPAALSAARPDAGPDAGPGQEGRPHERPLVLAGRLALANRIVVPPMASATGDETGRPTGETFARYARLAASGAGLVFVEYTAVHRSGRSDPAQLSLDHDGLVADFARLARVIKEHGARAGLQLTHAGGKTERAFTGGALMGASAIPVPVKGRELETPEPMDAAAIASWEEWFARAADRAYAAGFDVVELHAAHGYGLDQFVSPLTNARDDAHGGDEEGRARLLLGIVSAIRERHPARAIAVRLGAQDFLDGGLTPDAGARLARRLEAAGCDLIDVSSGVGGWRRPGGRESEGYLVPEAARIAAAVRIPVIGVGGIETLAFVDEGLRQGHFSLAAVGRAILEGRFPRVARGAPRTLTPGRDR